MCPESYIDDFPTNTRCLVEKCYDYIEKEEGYEVTFLMNCLLGLIDVVSEKHKDKIGRKKVSFFAEYLPETFNGTKTPWGEYTTIKKSDYNSINAEYFITKLRNSIAHQNIEAESDGERWGYVILKDFYVDDKTKGSHGAVQNFEIKLSISQLKALAIAISELVPVQKR